MKKNVYIIYTVIFLKEKWVNLSFYGKAKKRTCKDYKLSVTKLKNNNTYLCHRRCSWGLWWYSRMAATPWPANDIWSAAWWGRGDTLAGRHPGIPGDSGEDCQQEGGVIMGYCHRQVSVQGGLQHRPVCRSLLWSETTCLPLRHAVLSSGGEITPTHEHKWVKEKLTDLSKETWSQ